MIYCCIADIKTWDLCAMMRHAGELPVRQGCGQAFQATQQISADLSFVQDGLTV